MNAEYGKSGTEITTETPRASAPTDGDDDLEAPPPSIRATDAGAMQVFFAWEKLRLVYNGVLVLIVLSISGRRVIEIIGDALVAALCANLMVCAGPVFECYLSWLGVPRVPARIGVFVIGLLLSMAVTAGAAWAQFG